MKGDFFVDISHTKRVGFWIENGFEVLKREGIVALFKKIFKRFYFWILGVDFAPESLQKYDIENIQSASVCNHILDKSFDEIIERLKGFDLNITEGIFLDYGSGKGFTLYKASKAGFKEAVGVEFVEKFCKISQKNLEKLSIKNAKVINIDAIDFIPFYDTRVIFFHNPFDERVFEKVLDNLQKADFKKSPLIVYHYPLCENVFEKRSNFILLEKFVSPTSKEKSNFYRLIR